MSEVSIVPAAAASGDVSHGVRKVLLGLIGSGIQRSLTPAMHEREGAQQGLRVHYQLIDLAKAGVGPEVLPALIQAARVMDFNGLNVTYPCKQQVIPLLDDLSDEARAMGAVNTVVNEGGRLIGHNTDGSGWWDGLQRQLPQADLSRVVLLGAGGAGSAIAHAALLRGAQQLVINDADAARAEQLAHDLQARYGASRVLAEADVARALQGASGLVHATPTGMDKLPGLPLPESLLHERLWVSEIVYFPLQTALLKAAQARGCATSNGGGMAVGQAVRAFDLFNPGLRADADRMLAHFRTLVGARAD
ncbi:MAG: Quinate/shikimate dehydrogenase (NAD(+)) [Paracidovorax wautersii]|uniref:Shikimate dehydrogenase (NADP(+)) n=1 Tax=Paracidovorax wautersii TaxID=1177982 RepID=A0A7V8JPJ3_9BURK|nr:MAG: Quinate/shikimate dehydrogenase (NAD(+)) [Paracidovorax wautersii]